MTKDEMIARLKQIEVDFTAIAIAVVDGDPQLALQLRSLAALTQAHVRILELNVNLTRIAAQFLYAIFDEHVESFKDVIRRDVKPPMIH